MTSIHNAGITLNSNLQNLFVPIFDLHGIAQSYFPTKSNPHPPRDLYNRRMADATYFTPLGADLSASACRMAVNLAGALLFCWFLPQQKEQCKVWAEERLKEALRSLKRGHQMEAALRGDGESARGWCHGRGYHKQDVSVG